MHFPTSRSLLQSIMASALVLAGATGCNRGDRAETGSDASGAAAIGDTAMTGTGGDYGTGTADTTLGAGTDTMAPTGARTVPGTAMGDTAPAEIQSRTPPPVAATPSAGRQDTSVEGDTAAAGYRAMEQDTADMPRGADTTGMTADTVGGAGTPQDSDTAGAATDTAEVSSAIPDPGESSALGDTAAAGYVAMARDTSVAMDQIDATGAAAETDGTLQARLDTTRAETGVAADVDVHGDTLMAVRLDTTGTTVATADTTDAERIRPPEDSTELMGTVTTGETADELPVATADEEVRAEDRETVATTEARTDEVGAAAVTGGTITGAEAVALMTRQGLTCSVVDPSDREVRWDMSSTPVSLNPCGLGSMNLSKIWTEE